jgi:hypothetical protein
VSAGAGAGASAGAGAGAGDTIDAAPPQIDPDGDDDPIDTGTGDLYASAHFTRVGQAPHSLWHICDLTPFKGGLYAAHAVQPLGADGATISRYEPVDDDAGSPFRVAFDWNRWGEPVQGGGAGQGFLRVHAIGGRLFVTDADPPYAGFGVADPGTEGYVFVSDANGDFAPARSPGHRPPFAPSANDAGEPTAGAGVIPRAYHVIDAIRFRGRYYVSTGSVPPTERAWAGASPGALHVANADLSRWTFETDYPFPWQSGVWRLGYLVRFKDRLYAGIQDYDGREPNDYVVFDPAKDATTITHDDAQGVSVSGMPGTGTLRWFADAGRLFWIAMQRDGDVVLRVTRDGDDWTRIAFPLDAGRPTDVARFRGETVVLTERGLYRLDGDDDAPVQIAEVTEKKSPFEIRDFFCAAPLAVFDNALYAGGQIDGALYRVDPDP